MTRKWLVILIAISIVLATMLTGCGNPSSLSTDSLSDVTLAKGVDKNLKPLKPTYVFSSDTSRIYCTFTLTKESPNVILNAAWIYVNRENNTDYLIDDWTELTEGPRSIAMFINRPPSGWPMGDYKIVLYVDSKEELIVPFRIK